MNSSPSTSAPAGAVPGTARLLEQAGDRAKSPFDYIIVGSGAGGGPLACRLAAAGRRVLLIEAGQDPAAAGEVHDAPLYHGASTEHPDLSWQFSVRHYADRHRQEQDHKYDRARDPDGTGGVFYPRSSGLGGCTAHHAMIVIRPNDSDWEGIAEITNDDSWRAKQMQPYFAKFEQCLYIDEYRGFLANLFGGVSRTWAWLTEFLNPRLALDRGGHGSDGWQPTSFIAPQLIQRIIEKDAEFTTVLLKSAFRAIENSTRLTALLKRFLLTLGFVRTFDPNDVSNRAASGGAGVFLIPTGIGGPEVRDERGESLKGRRAGVREFLLRTQEKYPDRLVIQRGVHVKRVILEGGGIVDGGRVAPRAVGVVGVEGAFLYKASPRHQPATGREVSFFVRHDNSAPAGEVVLCGGTFNTPQMLMLSGVGEAAHLEEFGIEVRVDLPGVGRNLQDRYEVGVVSELREDLKSLETVSFTPGDPRDLVRREWVERKEGLYATNGGTIAILQRSDAASGPEADLFTFGAPAAFRGYYWNWSRELFKPARGAANDQRNLWTWVILKAYTRNNAGRVRLRSADPFETPSICFHSFDEGGVEDWAGDVEALVEAVESVRGINAVAGSPFVRELQPAGYLAAANEKRRAEGRAEWTLRDWIRNEAWGHHACGTCRLGADAWVADPAELTDKHAVLDSQFRVHGVRGLRVVDASVFPRIPGYFILAPIFMVSEKAADTLLQPGGDEAYPRVIRELEEQALRERRRRAWVDANNQPVPVAERPLPAAPLPGRGAVEPGPLTAEEAAVGPSAGVPVRNRVGLALSGGGVRSATFAMGFLQALAERGRLRQVDYLSTVSGGAFTGSFLGRLFMRERVAGVADPCGRAAELLRQGNSGPVRWLRTQANYLFAAGTDDWLIALGIFFRNIFTVHLVVGALLFTAFGILAGITRSSWFERFIPAAPDVTPWTGGVGLSPWWWVPLAMLIAVVLPMKLAYWLAPKRNSYRSYSPYPLAAWLVLLVGAAVALTLPGGVWWSGTLLVVLGGTLLWQEAVRKGLPEGNQTERNAIGPIVRNRLSRGLGEALVIFAGLVGWVVLDSLAGTVAHQSRLPEMVASLIALAPALQLLRGWAMKLFPEDKGSKFSLSMKALAVVIAVTLLFLVDVIARTVFLLPETRVGWGCVAVTILFSAACGRAFDFLNLSSLHATYAARIKRTFLGASNEARTVGDSNPAADVQIAHPDDDIAFHQYRPEMNGGPLHLITVCVNETVDHGSQREVRERKGLPMTLGTFGVSVGRRYFARWSRRIDVPPWLAFRRWLDGTDAAGSRKSFVPTLEAVRLNADAGTFHPLGRRDQRPAVAQDLSLGDWVAISGAAFSTGRGRATNLLECLFMGLLNARLGFWWDSGIRANERPGRFPANLWRRLKELPGGLFRMQELLLSEWRGRFPGPSTEFWNLSDGGHLDNSAVYELIRRRLPLILCTDATRDLAYNFEDLASLVRQVRVDFGVEVEWLESVDAATLPALVKDWVDVSRIGGLQDLKGNWQGGGPGRKHAAIARIRYPRAEDGTQPEPSWLVLIKASLVGDESLDVTQYARTHGEFPQDSTFDQQYDDEQWESYRKLGEKAGLAVLRQLK